MAQARQDDPARAGDGGRERVGDRGVEVVRGAAGGENDRAGDARQPGEIEVVHRSVGQGARTLGLQRGALGGCEALPGLVAGDGADEQLSRRGGAAGGVRDGDRIGQLAEPRQQRREATAR